ncbi:MAG: hypothetical protein Q7S76_00030, partial [bacterium]|nr:hypothetical protein [bacterium]
IWNPVSINQLAYEVEKKKHGTPSGGDNAAATFGGLIWYRKELEFLRSIWQLPFRMNEKLKPFYLVDTGRPKESTGEMVEYVASSVKRQASRLEELFNQNELETKRVAAAIKEGNEGELISAIKTGERSLEGMGVVSKKVITFLRLLEEAGGAGKILGGGGRHDGVGFLLCYHADQTRLDGLVKKYGFTMKDVLLGQEGVRLEKKL